MTYELEDVTIVLESPGNALPLGTGRNVSRKVAAVEALQLIGGFSQPEWAIAKAPGLKPFLDEDGTFYGAYGNRIGHQLDDVVAKLRDDPLTRQAVMTLWNPDLDNEPGHLDYPCTIAIGFSLHGFANDKLHMRVQMRSNDAWLGLPYDMFQFGQLQYTVANLLGVFPGRYVHHAWSLHLYESNLAESYNVVEPSKISIDALCEVQPEGLGHAHMKPKRLRQRAYDVAMIPDDLKDVNHSELWYVTALRD